MALSERHREAFRFFNEIGIIQQLAAAMFNRRLPQGLHVSHFAVLNHLTRLGDGKTPLSLASAFQVSKGTMSHTLSALEQRGLVAIAPNPEDRRSKLVSLTPAGHRYHAGAIEGLGPLFAFLDSEGATDDLVALRPQLSALRALLDENRDL